MMAATHDAASNPFRRRDPRRKERPLLIIAPSLFECWHAAKVHGLVPPAIENFRNVTRAIGLRGVTPGSPYILVNRDSWGATREGFELDQALSALERLGRVRPAGPDDIANCQLEGA